jgi:hypothetical protein
MRHVFRDGIAREAPGAPEDSQTSDSSLAVRADADDGIEAKLQFFGSCDYKNSQPSDPSIPIICNLPRPVTPVKAVKARLN